MRGISGQSSCGGPCKLLTGPLGDITQIAAGSTNQPTTPPIHSRTTKNPYKIGIIMIFPLLLQRNHGKPATTIPFIYFFLRLYYLHAEIQSIIKKRNKTIYLSVYKGTERKHRSYTPAFRVDIRIAEEERGGRRSGSEKKNS